MRDAALQLGLNYEAVVQIAFVVGFFLAAAAFVAYLIQEFMRPSWSREPEHKIKAWVLIAGVILILAAFLLWILDVIGEIFNWILHQIG